MKDCGREDLTTFTGDYWWKDLYTVHWNRYKNNPSYPQDSSALDLADRYRVEAQIAVHAVYREFIENLVERLRLNYSVLCICDLAVTAYLREWVEYLLVGRHGHSVRIVTTPVSQETSTLELSDLIRQLFLELQNAVVDNSIVLVENFDLMTMNPHGSPIEQTNNILYWLRTFSSVPILAFIDQQYTIPKAIEDVFDERKVLPPVHREDLYKLLRPEEAQLFIDARNLRTSTGSGDCVLTVADQYQLYQYVAGHNVVHIRWMMRTLLREATAHNVYEKIREISPFSDLTIPTVTENDIAGYAELKARLKKRVIFPLAPDNAALFDPDVLRNLAPKGVILHGPPRTGKTEIAKWLASELKTPLLAVRGPELINKYVGETERAIRELFAWARKVAPAVILIDEMDVLFAQRESTSRLGETSMVATFLTEMDGLLDDALVLVIGTTNRLPTIDDAFLAPSRFGVDEKVDYPNREDRIGILDLYQKRMGLDLINTSLDYLADKTEGRGGDHLRGICIEILREITWAIVNTPEAIPDPNDTAFLDGILAELKSGTTATAPSTSSQPPPRVRK